MPVAPPAGSSAVSVDSHGRGSIATASRSTEVVALVPDPSAEWSDERLVQACLTADQRAWEVLIARYKGLIYSFPRKYGALAHDAADVFQLVCADLFVALPRLRDHKSVRSWISTTAAHRAYKWKRHYVLRVRREEDVFGVSLTLVATQPPELLEAERAALVRRAVAQLPNRYRAVIQLLFLEEPPLPYLTVAQRLGVAPGSVSFLRARGLRKLERILDRETKIAEC